MKNIKKLSAIVLAILVLVVSLPTTSVFAATDADMYYGKKMLSQMTNSSKLLTVYELLVEGCANLTEEITFPKGTTLTENEIITVYDLFYADYPEYFWIAAGTPGASPSSSGYCSIQPLYVLDYPGFGYFEDFDLAKKQYNQAVTQLTSDLGDKTDYEKAMILHDRVCETITYTLDCNNHQNAYGALVEGLAVCNGYARAYQHLLKTVGVPTWYVWGESHGEGHAWNIVKLGGEWYYTDTTWDDTEDEFDFFDCVYEYFNITTTKLLEDHTIDSTITGIVPSATATEYNYYAKEDLIFSTFDINRIVSALKRNKDYIIHASVLGGESVANNFYNGFGNNIENIAEQLNASDYTYNDAMFTFTSNSYIFVLDFDITINCSHTYTNACDTSCNSCGAERIITHQYSDWKTTKEPTCDKPGIKQKVCSVCGDTISESIPSLGQHNYVATENAPTCTKWGGTKYTCSICGDNYFENTISPIGHTYFNACDTQCNACGKTRKATVHSYDECFEGYEDNDIFKNTWELVPDKTGIYFLGAAHEAVVLDSDGNRVKYLENASGYVQQLHKECTGGWPLVAGETYTVAVRCDGELSEQHYLSEKFADTIFPDTDKNGWYNDSVTYAVGAGIMSGYSNGKFGTSDSIQRQDFLVMLARYEGVDLDSYNYKSKFSDVARGSYYEAAVNWGAQNGIVTGYENGKFGVGDKVTREQLVTFLCRYAKFKNVDVSCTANEQNKVKNTYSDYKNVSSFAQEAILWAVTDGVIGGKTSTTIVPQGNAQRCEVAKIMYNIFLNDIF